MLHLQKKEGQACLQGSIVYKFYNPLPAHEGEGGGYDKGSWGGVRDAEWRYLYAKRHYWVIFFLNEQPISVQWEKYYSQKVGGI